MRIGIVGSGDVGRALGRGFARHGHEVRIGSREPQSEKLQRWMTEAGSRASTGSFADAAGFGDIVVLATMWSGTENAIRLAGPDAFAGKIVIDATNPLAFAPGGPPSLALGHRDSGGEQVQRWLPDASVVKCFNVVGNAHFVEPHFPGGPPDMFLCGNDPEAKRKVAALCRELGWPTVDIGGLDGARQLEELAMLWIRFGFLNGSWNHAFRLLRK